MHPATFVGCGIALAALCLSIANRPAATNGALAGALPPTAAQPLELPLEQGHLALVIEGTVQQLAITHAIGKQDPWGGAAKGLKSEFALRLLGADDVELLSVPIDLSHFDTDPTHIGKPVQVTGCEVRSSAIVTLVNVPKLDGVQRYEFARAGKAIGSTTAARVVRLVEDAR